MATLPNPPPHSEGVTMKIAYELQCEGIAMLQRGRMKFCDKYQQKAGNRVRAATVFANACLEEAITTYHAIGGIALVEQMLNARLEVLRKATEEAAETGLEA